MSFLRNALMTPITTLSERQLEDVERRRVVVLQDIMVQPPAATPAAAPIPPPGMTSTQEVAAPIPPPGMTSTQEVAAPDLKFFFEDFKPTPEEEEIDHPPTLSTFSGPTSSSAPQIEDLLNVYNPDLDESLADLSHLQSFLSPMELLSPIDSGDEFEKPVKRAKKMKKSAPVKKSAHVKKSAPVKASKAKGGRGGKLSAFRKKCEKNSPYVGWPTAPLPLMEVQNLVEVVAQVHRDASPPPVTPQVHRNASPPPVTPQVRVEHSEQEVGPENVLSQTVVEGNKLKESITYAQSVKKRYLREKKVVDGSDSRKRALMADISTIEAQKLELEKRLSMLRAKLQEEDSQQGKSLAYIQKYGPLVQEWDAMCQGFLNT
ncbi:uncharacterized protein [Leptinotarsa decemlineata]|uniref:uncharacterized protein n=1 Tax=Leptinotarsa decemlineata TaxID=7539 RepID=UPI003D309889